MSTNKVRDVWDDFADKYGADLRASTQDKYLIELEIRTLLPYFKDGDRVLDLGCGNGYTDIELLKHKKLDITGIDISPKLISIAKKSSDKIEFITKDILEVNSVDHLGTFDIVLTKRAIINILTWEEQMKVISKISCLLKPHGKYIMMEAISQGHNKIGCLREHCGMNRTPIRWHNRYLDMNELVPFLSSHYKDVTIQEFSSTYYVMSRVVQPFFLKPFKKEPSYEAFINGISSHLPNIGNYGLQKLIICTKGG